MSNINSAYFIYILPKIGGAKAPSAPPRFLRLCAYTMVCAKLSLFRTVRCVSVCVCVCVYCKRRDKIIITSGERGSQGNLL